MKKFGAYQITDLASLRKAAEKSASLARSTESAVSEFNRRKQQIEQNVEMRVAAVVDPQRREEARKLFTDEAKDALVKLRKETEEARWKHARELHAIAEDLKAVKEHLTNPIIIATAHNLGGERRGRIAREIEGLGPLALSNLRKQAELTGDKDLAAALILQNDKTAKRERLFDSKDLAEIAFGEDCATVKELANVIEVQHAKAIAAVRDSDGTKATPVQKISTGLKHPGERITPAGEPAPKERSLELLERMERALETEET